MRGILLAKKIQECKKYGLDCSPQEQIRNIDLPQVKPKSTNANNDAMVQELKRLRQKKETADRCLSVTFFG